MVLMVLETEALTDAQLPVEQLAAHLRLAEGYATVPGQDARLRQRLRGAIGMVERRLGKVMIAREVVLCGPSEGSDRIALPVAPVTDVLSVSEMRDGQTTAIVGARVEEDPETPCLVLPHTVSTGAVLQVTLWAGWGTWDTLPDPMCQAVLLTAEGLDSGDISAVMPMIETLLAPWRVRRLGRAAL
ncbi:hypothetical protein JANAI62_22740 [Jannaschia pagri]|uniref:Phage gp6-like head-tail connector protein n=1 Tax=Jannaschia pagri TaxID=2829797 RepID=A0ABQ4NMM1_9RHOB|nr:MULTISPECIES: hypothetical protein [unclassified Jannaschia]GIT91817.1 hypothetical protein JANAI61_22750 [Jannaschia sp. AI_61]GIT95651.1 hypothetical protein JANAI62_22740 [Jannaschia sp. AI_62]